MNLIPRRRSGLSTIVATTLMLAGVAVIGTTIVMWSNSSVRSYETTLALASSTRANAFNENLSIENVWYCHNPPPPSEPCHPTGGQYPAVNMTLTNIGSIGLNVTQISLASGTPMIITPYSIKNIQLIPGQYSMWASQYNWQSKIPITIKITTARGSIFTTQVTPP